MKGHRSAQYWNLSSTGWMYHSEKQILTLPSRAVAVANQQNLGSAEIMRCSTILWAVDHASLTYLPDETSFKHIGGTSRPCCCNSNNDFALWPFQGLRNRHLPSYWEHSIWNQNQESRNNLHSGSCHLLRKPKRFVASSYGKVIIDFFPLILDSSETCYNI